MTTEDDFQNAIDRQLDDWQTRLVFADWLDDRSDPRASGYRALGMERRCPIFYNIPPMGWPQGMWTWWKDISPVSPSSLSSLWWNFLIEPTTKQKRLPLTKNYPTRRAAEDAATVAFTKIPGA